MLLNHAMELHCLTEVWGLLILALRLPFQNTYVLITAKSNTNNENADGNSSSNVVHKAGNADDRLLFVQQTLSYS